MDSADSAWTDTQQWWGRPCTAGPRWSTAARSLGGPGSPALCKSQMNHDHLYCQRDYFVLFYEQAPVLHLLMHKEDIHAATAVWETATTCFGFGQPMFFVVMDYLSDSSRALRRVCVCVCVCLSGNNFWIKQWNISTFNTVTYLDPI